MAFATITPAGGSAVNFIRLSGNPQQPGKHLELITRPGADGIAARQTGTRAVSFNMGGVKDVQNADLDAKEAELMALKGTVCTILRSDLVSHTNILIQHVSVEHRKIEVPVGGIEGSAGAWMIAAQLQAVDASTT